MLFLIELDAFVLTLLLSFESLEEESSQLLELSVKVVWGNDIEDKLDFLSLILLSLDLGEIGLSLLSELGLLLVILLLPGAAATSTLIVVLALVGGSLGEVVTLSMVVVAFVASLVLRSVLLHFGHALDELFHLSVDQLWVDCVLERLLSHFRVLSLAEFLLSNSSEQV